MGDYIKRKETRKHLFDRLIETANNNTGYLSDASLVYQDAAERIRRWIDEIPAADVVERKKGFWYTHSTIFRTTLRCTNCQNPSKYQFNFCPNCGAQMEN